MHEKPSHSEPTFNPELDLANGASGRVFFLICVSSSLTSQFTQFTSQTDSYFVAQLPGVLKQSAASPQVAL